MKNCTIYFDDDELVRVRVSEFLQLGSDHLARSTPGRMEVDENQKISSGFQFGVEIGLQRKRDKGQGRCEMNEQPAVTSSLSCYQFH